MCIKDMDEEGLRSADMAFSTPSAAGHDVSLSSKHTKITTDNRAEYIRLALNYRFVNILTNVIVRDECSKQQILEKD